MYKGEVRYMKRKLSSKLSSIILVIALVLSTFCGYCEYSIVDASAMTTSLSKLIGKNNSNKTSKKNVEEQTKRIIVSLDEDIADLIPSSCVSIFDPSDAILVLISLLSVRHKTGKCPEAKDLPWLPEFFKY